MENLILNSILEHHTDEEKSAMAIIDGLVGIQKVLENRTMQLADETTNKSANEMAVYQQKSCPNCNAFLCTYRITKTFLKNCLIPLLHTQNT